MRTALIVCGALGREVQALVEKHQWDADILGITAHHHLYPERITPEVEVRLLTICNRYERVMVVYGDCGTYGALDDLLQKHNIPRVTGAHCYEFYGGPHFQRWLEEEPGTYFLTDFLVRTFSGTVIKGMGLDRHPELKHDYFQHYRRVIYLAQCPDEQLIAKAQAAADFLELPLQVEYTGYNLLESQLVAWMTLEQVQKGA